MTGPVSARELDRSQQVLLGVFGRPRTELVHGDGCYVQDADGRRYLDLLGGIAVSSLGHGHPALVEAVGGAARDLLHVSNFFVTPAQVELGEMLLRLAEAPALDPVTRLGRNEWGTLGEVFALDRPRGA